MRSSTSIGSKGLVRKSVAPTDKRPALGFHADVRGQHQDGQEILGLDDVLQFAHDPEAVQVAACSGRAGSHRAGARGRARHDAARVGGALHLRVARNLQQIFEQGDVDRLVIDDQHPHRKEVVLVYHATFDLEDLAQNAVEMLDFQRLGQIGARAGFHQSFDLARAWRPR